MGFVNNIQSNINNQSAGSTFYRRLGMGSSILSDATETNFQIRFRTAGTLSKFYTNILINDRGASTFRVRKNAANGNQILSIPASTTGEFEDIINTDSLISGDNLNYQTTTGAGGTTFTFSVARIIFKADSGTTTVYGGDASNIGGGTTYNCITASLSGASGSEDNNQTKMQTAGTFKNLGIYVRSNTRDAAVTFRFRVNEANVNQVVSIGSTLTGWFEDLVNTDIVAINNRVNHVGLGAGTAGTVTNETSRIELSTTNSAFMFAGCENENIAPSLTRYWPLAGDFETSATESDVVTDSGLKLKVSRMGIFLNTNTITSSSTVNFRKNAANGNQTFSITASTSGHFQDSTNTDIIQASDSVAYQIVTGGTGTNMNITTFEMLAVSGALKDVIGINTIPWNRP